MTGNDEWRATMLYKFIVARHNIFKQRLQHFPKPWTDDPILKNYRFCNVYRDLDKVSLWIYKNWTIPNQRDKYLWFAMVMARLINWPESLQEIGYPTTANMQGRQGFHIGILNNKLKNGIKAFSGAYIVSTNGVEKDKPSYIFQNILQPMWDDRDNPGFYSKKLQEIYEHLRNYKGMGSFLAGQVIADLKEAPRYQCDPDWWTFAVSGPGSRRGLNRVIGRPLTAGWNENVWKTKLLELREYINPMIERVDMAPLDAQNLQNCLCEFDKYERVRLGQGRPRANYNGDPE